MSGPVVDYSAAQKIVCSDCELKRLHSGDTGKISDGYHTFDELYEHRCHLFVALMVTYPKMSWRSKKHPDNTMFPGWFIAGMALPYGDVSYHLPMWMWKMLDGTGVKTLEHSPAWDGHTPEDVVNRLGEWICSGNKVVLHE